MENVRLKEEDILDRTKWKKFITIPATPDDGKSPRRKRRSTICISISAQVTNQCFALENVAYNLCFMQERISAMTVE